MIPCPKCGTEWAILGCKLCGCCAGCKEIEIVQIVDQSHLKTIGVQSRHRCSYQPAFLTEEQMILRGIKWS